MAFHELELNYRRMAERWCANKMWGQIR